MRAGELTNTDGGESPGRGGVVGADGLLQKHNPGPRCRSNGVW
jgi:hypothetical protein